MLNVLYFMSDIYRVHVLLLTYQNNDVQNISSDTVSETRAHNAALLIEEKKFKPWFLNFITKEKYPFFTDISSA